MTTLTDFLLQRIAEDEAVARAATPGPWRVDSVTYTEAIHGHDSTEVVSGGRWGGEASVFDSTETAVHIARHDPARVLAECQAKRAIMEAWIAADNAAGAYPGTDAGIEMGLAQALELLAQPFADHPDFRPEWRIA